MTSITVYEIRTDSIEMKAPHTNVKRFLNEHVDCAAAFPSEGLNILGEYSSLEAALEALKGYRAEVRASAGLIHVTSCWAIKVEYELDEAGERVDPFEEGDPITFAPFRDDANLYLDGLRTSYLWNGKEWSEKEY